LSYFYKHHELSLRLGFFWTSMSIADILAGFLAAGILQLRGAGSHSGWRWLFLIEGLLTFVIGILAFGLMPPSPTQTKHWFRGKNGWFSEREETIIVNRVIRDDPSKGDMHNRQPITPKLLWESLSDYDLWPLYAIGLTWQLPSTPPTQYLTLTLKGLGFDTFRTNLLTIPYVVCHIITMMILTYVAEIWKELTLTAMVSQIWVLPFLVYVYIYDITKIDKWVAWGVLTALLSFPSREFPTGIVPTYLPSVLTLTRVYTAHPIQVGWNSRNSNTVRSRTVSAAMYNMMCQASGIIASNIYRSDDAPRYSRGNGQLVAIVSGNIAIYLLTKAYYVRRNKSRDSKWNAMTGEERQNYLETTTDKGNKRLDFRFAH
jgi:MFS family permease